MGKRGKIGRAARIARGLSPNLFLNVSSRNCRLETENWDYFAIRNGRFRKRVAIR